MNGDGDAHSSATPADHPESSDSSPAVQLSFAVTGSSSPGPENQSTSSPETGNASATQLTQDFDSSIELHGRDTITVNLESSTPENTDVYADSTGGSDTTTHNEESHEWLPDGEHELKRVKVMQIAHSFLVGLNTWPNYSFRDWSSTLFVPLSEISDTSAHYYLPQRFMN